MPLTAEQLQIRSRGIGASEIAAIVGVHPYQNALDVFLEKTGQAEPFVGNEFTLWGNRLEAVIADEYAERTQVQVRRPCDTIIHPDHEWAFCTPDALVAQTPFEESWGLECKNRNYFNQEQWGEPGTDEVPLEVAAQGHWSMEVTGLRRWDVAVLVGGNRMGIYTLHYDEDVAKGLLEAGRAFWFDYVLPGITPPLDGSASASAYLKRKWPFHDEDLIKDPPLEIVQEAERLRVLRETLKATEAEKAAVENHLKDFIGDRAGLLLPDGKSKITWKRPKPTTVVAWDAIAGALAPMVSPDIYAETVKEHTSEKETARRFLAQFKEAS